MKSKSKDQLLLYYTSDQKLETLNENKLIENFLYFSTNLVSPNEYSYKVNMPKDSIVDSEELLSCNEDVEKCNDIIEHCQRYLGVNKETAISLLVKSESYLDFCRKNNLVFDGSVDTSIHIYTLRCAECLGYSGVKIKFIQYIEYIKYVLKCDKKTAQNIIEAKSDFDINAIVRRFFVGNVDWFAKHLLEFNFYGSLEGQGCTYMINNQAVRHKLIECTNNGLPIGDISNIFGTGKTKTYFRT